MSEQLDRGLAVAMRRPALFIGLFDLLWTLDALFPKAEAELKDLIDRGAAWSSCIVAASRA